MVQLHAHGNKQGINRLRVVKERICELEAAAARQIGVEFLAEMEPVARVSGRTAIHDEENGRIRRHERRSERESECGGGFAAVVGGSDGQWIRSGDVRGAGDDAGGGIQAQARGKRRLDGETDADVGVGEDGR